MNTSDVYIKPTSMKEKITINGASAMEEKKNRARKRERHREKMKSNSKQSFLNGSDINWRKNREISLRIVTPEALKPNL